MLTLGISHQTHCFTLQGEGVTIVIDFTMPLAGPSRIRYWHTVRPEDVLANVELVHLHLSLDEIGRLRGAGYPPEKVRAISGLLDPRSNSTWAFHCAGWERPALISTHAHGVGHRVSFDAPDAVRILRQPGFGHEVLARLRDGETPEQVNACITSSTNP